MKTFKQSYSSKKKLRQGQSSAALTFALSRDIQAKIFKQRHPNKDIKFQMKTFKQSYSSKEIETRPVFSGFDICTQQRYSTLQLMVH